MGLRIIDLGIGNIGSIQNMLMKLGHKSSIASNEEELTNANKIILPGVGSFDRGMKNLKSKNLIDVLNKKVNEDKIPILGICLGMQLMTQSSEEGFEDGLGWIEAKTLKFKSDKIKVPHMGWNSVLKEKESKILSSREEERRFYFVHSYHVKCMQSSDILATTFYDNHFVSMFEKDNIIGVQFHPEKSHRFGMDLLNQFVKNY